MLASYAIRVKMNAQTTGSGTRWLAVFLSCAGLRHESKADQ
jgi:hypothetical protein